MLHLVKSVPGISPGAQVFKALPPMVGKRRPGPKHPAYSIPASQWLTVVHRMVEKKEPLRTVAAAYGVSHETIRRIMLHVQEQRVQQEV